MKTNNTKQTGGELAAANGSAWERRFRSRKLLADSEILQSGDAAWMWGDWHEIPETFVGLHVREMAIAYGADPRPTMGRRKPNTEAHPPA